MSYGREKIGFLERRRRNGRSEFWGRRRSAQESGNVFQKSFLFSTRPHERASLLSTLAPPLLTSILSWVRVRGQKWDPKFDPKIRGIFVRFEGGGGAFLVQFEVGGSAFVVRFEGGGGAFLVQFEVGGCAFFVRFEVGGCAFFVRFEVGGCAFLVRFEVGRCAFFVRFEVGGCAFFVRFQVMDNEVQKSHSCSSSTCNGWRNQNCDVVFRGGGVSTIDGVSPLCLCGQKTVVRTARTTKNRGKQFWSCPKYKTGHEGGCNFFKWCCEDGDDKSYTNVKWEEKHESLSKTREMGGGSKMMSDLIKSVNVVEKWMKE
ncbi:hypothetical protein LR48_Vigan211s000300 [Vigna angularis]|uniref:GRF-type domain-containing protein n=1 Tax=Phaseolus angularis TaxID=3914 RepID=A0A0L9T5W5_PHAAN|nr:hypothetical protein LR48_Vigan211s000300 [Vigna angularis]